MSDEAKLNTDHEIWRGKSRAEFGDPDCFYADSLFVPQSDVEALGINCSGNVIVKPIREWHRLAAQPTPNKTRALEAQAILDLKPGKPSDDMSAQFHEGWYAGLEAYRQAIRALLADRRRKPASVIAAMKFR